MVLYRLFPGVLLMIVIHTACGDLFDLADSELAPNQAEYAVPIINSHASFREILDVTDDQVRFSIQADGTLELIYDSDAISISAAEILLPVPILIDIPLEDSISVLNFNFLDGLNGQRAIFKNNTLQFKAFPPDSDSYSVVIRIPKFIDTTGEVFSYTLDIPENSFGQEIKSEFIDLTGIELQSGFDQIEVLYDARNSAGERVLLPNISARVDFLIFSYVEGSFGRQVFNIPSGVIPFNTFRNYVSGQINFDDPVLRIQVENSFGLPIEPRINILNILTRQNVNFPLTSRLFLPGMILFDYPSLSEIGSIKESTVILDKTNSNIQDVITEQANAIFFDIDALAFPNNDQETVGFIRDDSRIDIRSELILPVKGTVENFVLFDDFPVDSLRIDEAEELSFNLGIDNGLPLGVRFQIHFVGKAYNVIDSLFTEPIFIDEALVNTEGEVIQAYTFFQSQTLDEALLRKIEPTGFIRTYISLNQPDDRTEAVSVNAEHGVTINLGAKIKWNQ